MNKLSESRCLLGKFQVEILQRTKILKSFTQYSEAFISDIMRPLVILNKQKTKGAIYAAKLRLMSLKEVRALMLSLKEARARSVAL